MKRKVMEINNNGTHLVCIKDDAVRHNPYRLYRVWWDGGKHRKQIEKYADFESVLRCVLAIATVKDAMERSES